MPPEIVPLIYWDADVFLTYINGTIIERMPHLDAFLEKSGRDIQLITSTITVVEVAWAKAEQDGKALSAAIEAKINLLWSSPTAPVKMIEFHPQISEQARNLMRYALSQGWQLKPLDAIHMASAKSIGVAAIHTYDDKWDKFSSHLGIKIELPISDAPRLPFTG